MVMGKTQEGSPNSGSTFQAFAHIMSMDIPLAKANHMTVCNISAAEKYVWSLLRGTVVSFVKDCESREG